MRGSSSLNVASGGVLVGPRSVINHAPAPSTAGRIEMLMQIRDGILEAIGHTPLISTLKPGVNTTVRPGDDDKQDARFSERLSFHCAPAAMRPSAIFSRNFGT